MTISVPLTYSLPPGAARGKLTAPLASVASSPRPSFSPRTPYYSRVPLTPANPLYKTRLCERHEVDGYCPYGSKCTFAHGVEDLRTQPGDYTVMLTPVDEGVLSGQTTPLSATLRSPITDINPLYKTKLCERFMTDSFCQYGPHCHFAHGPEELRAKPVLKRGERNGRITPTDSLSPGGRSSPTSSGRLSPMSPRSGRRMSRDRLTPTFPSSPVATLAMEADDADQTAEAFSQLSIHEEEDAGVLARLSARYPSELIERVTKLLQGKTGGEDGPEVDLMASLSLVAQEHTLSTAQLADVVMEALLAPNDDRHTLYVASLGHLKQFVAEKLLHDGRQLLHSCARCLLLRSSELSSKTQHVLRLLYDHDVIPAQVFLQWAQQTRALCATAETDDGETYTPVTALRDLLDRLKEFFDWLEIIQSTSDNEQH
ncbi:hypothetical protein RI367_000593 [Sorochytrium milnesiophthora]